MSMTSSCRPPSCRRQAHAADAQPRQSGRLPVTRPSSPYKSPVSIPSSRRRGLDTPRPTVAPSGSHGCSLGAQNQRATGAAQFRRQSGSGVARCDGHPAHVARHDNRECPDLNRLLVWQGSKFAVGGPRGSLARALGAPERLRKELLKSPRVVLYPELSGAHNLDAARPARPESARLRRWQKRSRRGQAAAA
jgi:hypothetical protein